MQRVIGIAAILLVLWPGGAAAQENAAIAEIRATWERCTAVLADSDDWTGWRRNFGGGYADHFQLYEATHATVLVQTWLIDAIATQRDTSCFRADGTLAFIHSAMTSPNVAADGPALSREGRIYFAPDGEVIRVLTQVLEDGRKIANMDTESHSLARGCGLTAPHMTVDAARLHLEAELGTIDGTRPDYTPVPLDCCALGE